MQNTAMVNRHFDRVRAHTAPSVNDRIDRTIEENIEYFSTQPDDAVSRRLLELKSEWDIERVLQTNASLLAFSGCLLAAFVDKRWIVLPIAVTGFLFQHAVQGWCPPLPMFRRFGVRTKSEIDAEKFALKALRGDFDGLKTETDAHRRSQMAIRAVTDE